VRPIDLPAAGDGSPANGVGGPDTRRENRYSLMLAYPDGPAEDRTKGMIRYHSRAEISLAEAVGVEYAVRSEQHQTGKREPVEGPALALCRGTLLSKLLLNSVGTLEVLLNLRQSLRRPVDQRRIELPAVRTSRSGA
jgi:hypothetical protein